MASGAKSVWLEIQIFLISLVLSVAINAVLTMVYAPIVEFISVNLNVTNISAAGILSFSTVIFWVSVMKLFLRHLCGEPIKRIQKKGMKLLIFSEVLILLFINLILTFEIGKKITSFSNLLFINEEYLNSLILPLGWMTTGNVFFVLVVVHAMRTHANSGDTILNS